jgi:hypothetical protein
MGYDTQFHGQFDLKKGNEYVEMTYGQAEILYDFAHERHGDDPEVPGIWCQWVATPDNDGIEWDGIEKFYNYVEWLAYVVKKFLNPWGYQLDGEVVWIGESLDPLDVGKINCMPIDGGGTHIRVSEVKFTVTDYDESITDGVAAAGNDG